MGHVPVRVWFAALRTFAFPASVLSLLVGTAAAAPLHDWRWGVLGAELLAVLLLHGIGNLLNDYFDFRSGVDTRTNGDEGRPGRVIVKGWLTPRQVLGFVALHLLLLIPLGVFLIRDGGMPAAWLVGVGLVGGYAYTGKPFELKYHALGDLCIFLVFGPAIVAGAAWMQVHRIEPRVLAYSVPLGLLITAIVSSNFLRDIEEDAGAGISTLAHRLGRQRYRVLFLGILFLPTLILAGMVAAGYASPWTLLTLAALPASIPPARCALRDIRRPDVDALTARYMATFGGLLLAGLVIAGR